MKARCKTKVDEGLTREDGPLTASELSVAELYWIKEVQKPLHERLRSGEFKVLSAFLSEAIIRVGGRVDKIKRSYEARHPALIPNGHHVAKLITRYYHQQGHAGVATTLAKIRTRYWIPGVQLLKSEKYRCVACREMEKRAETQFMSELPAERMMPFTPPFYATSCDYFGPIPVRIWCNKTAKYYGIIFTCLNTRSVHLEVARDCSTMKFLQALRRFFAVRGQPPCLISDNGKQFVGAERELREMLEGWSADELKEFCAERGTDWRFVTPLAPHYNGCAEALVKSCKLALKKAIKDHCLFPFELYTYLQEVANLVNQRPIGRIPTDPDDDSYLCPMP
nr:uncharacterized protein LOC129280088 [Lytechinus pictus]